LLFLIGLIGLARLQIGWEEITGEVSRSPVINVVAAAVGSAIENPDAGQTVKDGLGNAIPGKEADELVMGVIQRGQVIHPVGSLIILNYDRTDVVVEGKDASPESSLVLGSGGTGIGSLEYLLIGKDEADAVDGGLEAEAPIGSRPA